MQPTHINEGTCRFCVEAGAMWIMTHVTTIKMDTSVKRLASENWMILLVFAIAGTYSLLTGPYSGIVL